MNSMIPVYLESSHWPVVRSQSGRLERCADNYGDVECPFCDKVICAENNVCVIGQACRGCGAVVVDFKKWGD